MITKDAIFKNKRVYLPETENDASMLHVFTYYSLFSRTRFLIVHGMSYY